MLSITPALTDIVEGDVVGTRETREKPRPRPPSSCLGSGAGIAMTLEPRLESRYDNADPMPS